MKLLKAKTGSNKQVFEIAELHFEQRMNALPEILQGEELINPIEILKHHYSKEPRFGANGTPYKEKNYSVWRGNQRVQAAKELGYTHIEGIIINE